MQTTRTPLTKSQATEINIETLTNQTMQTWADIYDNPNTNSNPNPTNTQYMDLYTSSIINYQSLRLRTALQP